MPVWTACALQQRTAPCACTTDHLKTSSSCCPLVQPISGVLAGLAAASLVLSPIAPALAGSQDTQSPVDQAYEAEREIQDQRAMVSFVCSPVALY
eukprot:1155104-Pelagomonas_calceolata.AAC.1